MHVLAICLFIHLFSCFGFCADENTRSKFLFYGGPDCVNINDGLEYYIDSGIIPDFLGGPCPVSESKSLSLPYIYIYFVLCILSLGFLLFYFSEKKKKIFVTETKQFVAYN